MSFIQANISWSDYFGTKLHAFEILSYSPIQTTSLDIFGANIV